MSGDLNVGKKKCEVTESGSVAIRSRHHHSTAYVIHKEGKSRHLRRLGKDTAKGQRGKQNCKVRFQETLGEITDFIARKHKGLFFKKHGLINAKKPNQKF